MNLRAQHGHSLTDLPSNHGTSCKDHKSVKGMIEVFMFHLPSAHAVSVAQSL